MDYNFVKQLFEYYYGEGCVEYIDFCPKMRHGIIMHTLFVHIDCKYTPAAMSMRENLNNGNYILLDVVFDDDDFHSSVKLVKKHIWKCVKSRINAKKQLAYAKSRAGSNQLREEQRIREEQRGIEEILLLLPAPRNLEKLEELLSGTAKYAELCKGALTEAIALAKAKAVPSDNLWEYDLSNSTKRVVLENRMEWFMLNHKSLQKTLDTAAEQIKYIKFLQESITSQAKE
jgi:hypothetical protein